MTMQSNLSNLKKIYYGLFFCGILLAIISGILESFAPINEIKYLEEIFNTQMQHWEMGIFILYAVLGIAILIGLFFRKEWGRLLFVYSYMPSTLITLLPYMRWNYTYGPAELFSQLSTITDTILFTLLIIPSFYKQLFIKDND